jgi:hypothetical protein
LYVLYVLFKGKASLPKHLDDRKKEEKVDTEESDDDPFGIYSSVKELQTAGLNLEACATPAKKEAERWLSESDEEDGEMGCGLFDDDEPVPFSTANFEKEKKPIHEAEKYPEKASERISDTPSSDLQDQIPSIMGKNFQ